MKKPASLFLIFCLGLALLAVAGCAPRPLAAEPDPAALVITVPKGAPADALTAAAAAYEQRGGGPVRVSALGSDAYAGEVAAALLAGLDRYDLVYLPADSLARWVRYRALRPFEGAPTAGIEAWLPPLTFDGQVYALPAQAEVTVLWYRADLLQAAGLPVPGDWAAYRAAAQAMHAPPEVYGAVIAGSDIDAAAGFAPVLAGFGGQAVGGAQEGYPVTITAPAAHIALAFYAGLRTQDELTPPGAQDFTQADVLNSLRQGRAASGFGPLSAAGLLRDCEASPQACRDGQPLLSWAWLPGLPPEQAVGSLSAWAVPLHAAHPAEAQRFAAWLNSPEGARIWALNGGFPAQSVRLAEGDPPGMEPAWAALAGVETFSSGLPPVWTSEPVWKAYHTAVHAAVAGERSPRAALEEAVAPIQETLRMGGYTGR